MKHYRGQIINIYDGDLIGWTTATLIKRVGNVGEYERWTMLTKEGYELRRILCQE